MGLLDFVKSAGQFKVKTRERTLVDGEVALLTETAGIVVPPSDEVVHLVSHTIADEIKENSGKNKRKFAFSNVLPPMKKARTRGVRINEPVSTTTGKSPAVIKKLITYSGQAQIDSGVVASHAEEFVSSFVTPTSEHDYEDESISTHDNNVRTCPLSDQYFNLSSSSADTDILTFPKVAPPIPSLHADANIAATVPVTETGDSSIRRTGVGEPSVLGNETGNSFAALDHGSPIDDFYDYQAIDSVTAHNIYVPNWDVTNYAQMDDPIMCRNLVDHLPPPGWASLRNHHDSNFLNLLNVNSAQHACMVSELRLWYENEIIVREKFEQKFLKSSEAVQQRDAKIVVLKTKLEKAENEAVGVFSGQVSGLESVRDGLKGKVVELESECERLRGQVEGEAKLKERFVVMQDAEVQRLVDRGSALDARLSKLSYQGLEAGVKHGKAGRELSAVAAYDLGVTTRYEEAVGELENISLPFLDCLESYEDVPLERVMASLYLKGFLNVEDETPDFCKLQLVLEQVTIPIGCYLRADDSSLATTVTPLNTLAIADYQISSLVVVDTTFSTTEPHDDLFDATILDKLVDS
ncbi:hypothetical protein Tco_0144928 [Tanacetum coccineum]